MSRIDAITRLINAFSRLPGVGERTATRLAFFVLNQPAELAEELAAALVEVTQKVGLCERCCNLTESALCSICGSLKRNPCLVCVVENGSDLRAIERTGDFSGTYHVLHGLISPLDGVGPDDVRIRELLERLRSPEGETAAIEEVIVATSPSVDGEATALYISRLLKPLGVSVTRIASGVPIGAHLEYTDRVTLSRALSERRPM